jgi:hypothetical protein
MLQLSFMRTDKREKEKGGFNKIMINPSTNPILKVSKKEETELPRESDREVVCFAKLLIDSKRTVRELMSLFDGIF